VADKLWLGIAARWCGFYLLSPETHDVVLPAVPASESHCRHIINLRDDVHLSNLAGEIFLSAALNFLLVSSNHNSQRSPFPFSIAKQT
jgi:hypothetical protein